MRHLLPLPLLLAVACSPASSDEPIPENLGRVRLAAEGGLHDVARISYDIAEPSGNCQTGPFVAHQDAYVEAETLLPDLGSGDGHRFSDALFLLPPGAYHACATPLRLNGIPSLRCAAASQSVTVSEGTTTEVVLVSQCDGDDSGGLDVVTALNDAPVIEDVSVSPSKFIHLCESVAMSVTATDPDGDPITYAWQVTDAPPGSVPVLTPTTNSATFATDTVGSYELTVTASDPHGGEDSLTFNLHVDADPCTPPGHVDWMVSGGGPSFDAATAAAIAPNGDVILSATFGNTANFGFGSFTAINFDGLIMRLDATGGLVWQKVLTLQGNQEPAALALDANGDLFVAGSFSSRIDLGCGQHLGAGASDGFFAKLDGATGTCLWSHTLGDTGNDYVTAIGVDGAGNLAIGGHFGSNTLTFPGAGAPLTSGGGFDLFYASYDGAGNHRWSHHAGANGQDRLWALDVRPSGEVVIAGAIATGSATFFPGVVSPPPFGEDFYVAVLSGVTGGVIDLLTSQASGNDRAPAVAFDPTGAVVLGFELAGTVDLGQGPMTTTQETPVVARFSPDLVLDWATPLPVTGLGADVAAVGVTPYGDVRVLGDFAGGLTIGSTSYSAISGDAIYVAALSGINGSVQWSLEGQSSGDDEAYAALAVDTTGACYVGGRFGNDGAPDFTLGDAPTAASNGQSDLFFARLSP